MGKTHRKVSYDYCSYGHDKYKGKIDDDREFDSYHKSKKSNNKDNFKNIDVGQKFHNVLIHCENMNYDFEQFLEIIKKDKELYNYVDMKYNLKTPSANPFCLDGYIINKKRF